MELSNVHAGDPATSAEAAAATRHSWPELRHALLVQFDTADLTYDEAGALAEIGEYNQRRRCSDLKNLGLIEPTGETRPSRYNHQMQVYRITEDGRTAVATGELPSNVTPHQTRAQLQREVADLRRWKSDAQTAFELIAGLDIRADVVELALVFLEAS